MGKGVEAIVAAKVKIDAADAEMLAHLLRTDLLVPTERRFFSYCRVVPGASR